MKKLSLIFLLLFTVVSLKAQDEETPEQRLDRMVNTLLSDYETYGQLVADFNNPTISEEYKQAFKELFASGTTIFNDIVGSDSYGEYISPSNYLRELEGRYPKGLSISLLGRRKIVDLTDKKSKGYDFTLVMKVTKEFEGRNSAGEYESENVDLFVTVGVSQGYKNVAIVGISNEYKEEEVKEDKPVTAGRDLEERKKERAKQEKDRARRLASLSRRDRIRRERHQRIGVTWRPALTTSRGFLPEETSDFYLEAAQNTNVFDGISEGVSFSPLAFSIDYNYFLNSNLGFGIGLGYAQANYQLKGDILNEAITDQSDGTTFYDWTGADVDGFTGQEWGNNFFNIETTNSSNTDTLFASQRHFRAVDLKENYRRTTIEIPISIIYKDRIGGTGSSLGWFVSADVKIDFVLSDQTTFEGRFLSYNNYSYDIVNGNDDFLGSDVDVRLYYLDGKNSAEDIYNQIYYLYDDGANSPVYEGKTERGFEANKTNVWGELSAGIEFRVIANPDIWLTVAPVFQWGFLDVSTNRLNADENPARPLYQMRRTVENSYGGLSNQETDDYLSLFRSQQSFQTHAYGLRVGLFYEFGKSRY